MDKDQIKTQSFENSLNEADYKYLKDLDKEFLNNFDPTDDSTKFTKEHYEELNKSLIRFKDGDREAGQYIIASFHRILHAYAHFIVLQKIPYRTFEDKKGFIRVQINPSILNFIKLFTPSENKPKKGDYKGAKSEIRNNCQYIYALFNQFEYGEIYNELILALLNMANKYKVITDKKDPKYKPNGTFHIYVQKCFHFEAYHFLTALIRDPLVNLNITALGYDEEGNFDDNTIKASMSSIIDESTLRQYNTVIDCVDRQIAIKNTNALTLKEKENLDIYDSNSLNFNWINGITCNEVFKELTPYERELLVLSYDKNQTEDVLAELFGYSRSTIGSHKRKAIAKLKEALEKNNKIKS